MKTTEKYLMVLAAVGGLTIGQIASAAVANLNNTATTFGLTPAVALNQGSAAGIADGDMFDWLNRSTDPTSPRVNADSNLQPWMTWTSDQQIRSVRVWADIGISYDRLRIDRLDTGGNTAVEGAGGWINVYDTSTGLGQRFVDIDLGSTITTSGLRVRADRTGTDINVGEVAVFETLPTGGTLTSRRVFPTSVAASSNLGPASSANDADWYSRWLGDAPGTNPGSDYTYDMFFSGVSLDAVSLTFPVQAGGFSSIPSSWELLADTGSGLTSLGTFSSTTAQNGRTDGQYYTNLGLLFGVTQLRLRVAEADVSVGAVGLQEFEAFLTIPEPGTLGLLAAGAGLVWWRRLGKAGQP